MLDGVGSDSLGYKLHSATQRRRLVVKEGLLEVHLSHLSNWFKYSRTSGDVIPHFRFIAWLTCSFCCDLLAAGVSLSSADVGVILRMMPPLLAVLPDTKAARSLRNSPGTRQNVGTWLNHVDREPCHFTTPRSTHQEMDNMYREAADPPGECNPTK